MTWEMSQVSRPMQVLLLVTVLLAGAWFVALRPKGGDASSATSQAPSAPGVNGLTHAVDAARGAVTTADGAAQRSAGQGAATTPAPTASHPAAPARHRSATRVHHHHAARAHHRHATHAARHHHATRAHHRHATHVRHRHATRTHHAHGHGLSRIDAAHVRLVARALRRHEAIAIAFVDPAIADARAVATEIAHVSSFHGRAVALSAPIGQLSLYGAITKDVEVTVAPTTVIVSPHGKATTIVGFADRVEIQQRLADALAS